MKFFYLTIFLLLFTACFETVNKQIEVSSDVLVDIDESTFDTLLNLLFYHEDTTFFLEYLNSVNAVKSFYTANSGVELNYLRGLIVSKREKQLNFIKQLIEEKVIEKISITKYQRVITDLREENFDKFILNERLVDIYINNLLINSLCKNRIMPNKFDVEVVKTVLPNDSTEFEIHLVGIDDRMTPTLNLNGKRIKLSNQWAFKAKYSKAELVKEIHGKLSYKQNAEINEIPIVLK